MSLQEHCCDIKVEAKYSQFRSRADRRLYANLFVTCKARDGNLDNAFACCLNDIVKPSLPPPNVEVQIIDAAAFVNINKTKTLETFGQYYSEEIPWKVQRQLGI